MKRQLFKIAAATVRRFGILCAVFMFVSFYLVFSAAKTYSDMRAEKLKPAEITASITGSGFNIADITGIDGVLKATPLLTTSGAIVIEDYSTELTIEGINGEYLDTAALDGGMFPDKSTMPYIILNDAAVSALRDEDGRALGEDAEIDDEAILRIDRDITAEIVGVIDDESDTPKAILSYDTLKQLLSTQQTSFTARITLENAGYEASVTAALNELGYFVSGDSSSALIWAEELALARQTVLIALSFTVCAAALVIKSAQLERATHAREFEMLRTAGLTGAQINGVLCIRASMVISISAIAAATAALIGGMMTLIGIAGVLIAGTVLLGTVVISICRK